MGRSVACTDTKGTLRKGYIIQNHDGISIYSQKTLMWEKLKYIFLKYHHCIEHMSLLTNEAIKKIYHISSNSTRGDY